jgi:hypothetical protein
MPVRLHGDRLLSRTCTTLGAPCGVKFCVMKVSTTVFEVVILRLEVNR